MRHLCFFGMDKGRQHYETTPYPHQIHAATHPLRLAAAAKMAGHSPPDPRVARVLELACATGANLIAVAESLPQTTCVGIDYAQGQINAANSLRNEIGLPNVQFIAQDIREFRPEGQFDYIIAHGLYTWVPQDVRDAVMRLIRTGLAPNGIAAIGYNTLPGWSQTLSVRRLMQETFGEAQLRERPELSHPLLKALTTTWELGGPGAAWAPIGKSMLAAGPMLGFDHYGVINEPIYLREFAEQSERHALRHLADAYEPLGGLAILPPHLHGEIEKLKLPPIQQEQLADLARARSHRVSMVVHRDVPLHAGNPIAELSLATSLRPGPGELPSEFTTPRGSTIRSTDRLLCAFIMTLIEHQEAHIPFAEALQRARSRVNVTSDELKSTDLPSIARSMLANNLITVSASQKTPATPTIPEKPKLSKLNRIYATRIRRIVGESGWSKSVTAAEADILASLDGSLALAGASPIRALVQQLCRHGAVASADKGFA